MFARAYRAMSLYALGEVVVELDSLAAFAEPLVKSPMSLELAARAMYERTDYTEVSNHYVKSDR